MRTSWKTGNSLNALNKTDLDSFTRETKSKIEFLNKSTVEGIHEDSIPDDIEMQKSSECMRFNFLHC